MQDVQKPKSDADNSKKISAEKPIIPEKPRKTFDQTIDQQIDQFAEVIIGVLLRKKADNKDE